MFSRKGKGRRGNEPFTYIHEGTVVRGDLEATGRVRVHGTVHGNVTVEGVLEVAAEGSIKGERVEAEQVRILGTVEALVAASGKVEIWRGGSLDGDVRAASLDIEEGASFTGRSEMRPAGARPALPRASDSAPAEEQPQEVAVSEEGQPDSVSDDEQFPDALRSAPPVEQV
ncbi:MAG TPA: polymer-forming cytoskeletal protein [Trueperaceae bacterium]